jgi:hypothetical protein
MYHFGYWGWHGFWGFPGFWAFGWVAAAIAIIPFWKICMRVGLSPWLSLLLVIPLVGWVFVYYLAFADWPAEHGAASGSSGMRAPTDLTPPPPEPGTGPTTPGR